MVYTKVSLSTLSSAETAATEYRYDYFTASSDIDDLNHAVMEEKKKYLKWQMICTVERVQHHASPLMYVLFVGRNTKQPS